MPKYKVKSNISHGTTDAAGKVTTREYVAGSTIELSEAQAMSMSHAVEGAPIDPAVPESTRLRPDNRDSGVAAVHKIDATAEQIKTSNEQALQNVLDAPSAEHSGAPLAADLEKNAKENIQRASRPAKPAEPVKTEPPKA